MAEQRQYSREQRDREQSEQDAPIVRAATGNQKSVESASDQEEIPDALGNPTEHRAAARLADKTQVKEFGTDERTGEKITAAASDPDKVEAGPYGMALPERGELAGGNLKKVLEAPPETEPVIQPMVKEQAAMATKVGRQLAGLIARPVSEWGIIGPGERIRGHMLLLDMNTGEKVRAMDGHRVNKGELYLNLRNVPESLATGDTISRVLEA